jgi:hypothetical protein
MLKRGYPPIIMRFNWVRISPSLPGIDKSHKRFG